MYDDPKLRVTVVNSYILDNYASIQKEMETNMLATNENFINQISQTIIKRS